MIYIGGVMKINKSAVSLIFLLFVVILLISCSFEAKEGALRGIALSERVIIPSLLPLLIIFNLIQSSSAGRLFEKLLSPVTRYALRLPKCTGGCVFFGLMGGFPSGAILTNNLYENGDIDDKTARRLLRFNFSGGPAFIITAVGTGFLQSKKAGLILFASVTLSSIIIAVLTSFFAENEESGEYSFAQLSVDEALTKSVEQAIKSVLSISAYIILFSAVNSIITVPSFLAPIIEITSGINESCKGFSIPQLAFFLSFGGLCIHLQIFGIIKRAKMKYLDFLLWRVIGAFFAYICAILLLKAFPVEAEVFSNYSDNIYRFTSVNATLSVLMVLGCAVFIFDLEGRKTKC